MVKSDSDYLVKLEMFCVKALHYILTCVLFYIVWLNFRYNEFPQVKDVGFRYNYLVAAAFAALLAFFNRTYNSYFFGYSQIRTLALAQILSQLFSIGIIYFAVSLGWNHFENPVMFCLLMLGYIILDAGFALIGNRVYFHLNPSRKTILIYRNKQDRKRFGSIKGKPTEKLYTIVKEIEFDGTFDELRDRLKGYDMFRI